MRIREGRADRRRLAEVIDPKSSAEDLPELTDPVVVAAFEGWNDAGDAATGAVEHLELIWDAKPLERSEEHTSELQSRQYLVCRLLLEKKKKKTMLDIPTGR